MVVLVGTDFRFPNDSGIVGHDAAVGGGRGVQCREKKNRDFGFHTLNITLVDFADVKDWKKSILVLTFYHRASYLFHMSTKSAEPRATERAFPTPRRRYLGSVIMSTPVARKNRERN
jgi:hypothetical protein